MFMLVEVEKQVTDIGQYGGYNGGGGSSTRNDNVFNMTGTGGGATDIRIESGLKVNDEVHRAYTQNFNSLKTRIMVAAGGGGATALNTKISGEAIAYKNGAAGGGLIGYNGESPYSYGYPKGGTQVAPGAGHNYTTSHGGAFTTAAFGIGGATGWYPWGSGGAGYYGGGSAGGYSGSGASGSSFISGHAGCDAISEISTESKIVHTGQANHYSNLVFTNTVMVDGAGYNWINVKGSQTGMPSHDGDSSMIGNTGNGYAKITYLG